MMAYATNGTAHSRNWTPEIPSASFEKQSLQTSSQEIKDTACYKQTEDSSSKHVNKSNITEARPAQGQPSETPIGDVPLEVCIKAILEVLTDINESQIKSIAERMSREGKSVNSESLLKECDNIDTLPSAEDGNRNETSSPVTSASGSSLLPPPQLNSPSLGLHKELNATSHPISNGIHGGENLGTIQQDDEDFIDGEMDFHHLSTSMNHSQKTNPYQSLSSSFQWPIATSLTPSQSLADQGTLAGQQTSYSLTAPNRQYIYTNGSFSTQATFSASLSPKDSIRNHYSLNSRSNTTGTLSTNRETRDPKLQEKHNTTGLVSFHQHKLLPLIEKEHKLLKALRQCSQCHVKPRDITFLPCGHFTACRECAVPIYVCTVCKKNVLATVDTYLS